ncbi:MAG: hypothetical protein MPF33_10430 [Candidatus Aramenus sp.]|jgi:hypothetical protein|nr:hypothetical protein [Candidatus Aramenus sp.]
MEIKIKPILNVIGHEEFFAIPIARQKNYLLALNFYEDVVGGNLARFVLILDKYEEVNSIKVVEGDKGVVEAYRVKEAFDEIRKQVRLPKILVTPRIPFFVNIKVKNKPETMDRGVVGYLNYVNKYGEIKAKLTLSDLKIEELV